MKSFAPVSGVLAILLAVLFVPSSSYAGTYQVKQCESPGIYASPSGPYTGTQALKFSSNMPGGSWEHENQCGGSLHFRGKTVATKNGVTYNQGDIARFKISTNGAEGLGFTAVTAGSDTFSTASYGWVDNHVFHNNGSNGVQIPGINRGPDYWSYALPAGQARTDFEANLRCIHASCLGGYFSAFTSIASINLTVRDNVAPMVFHAGTLFGGGLISGTRTASAVATDGGSGVFLAWMIVNGQVGDIAFGYDQTAGVSCNPSVPTYNSVRPCVGILSGDFSFDTSQAPFVNGANSVYACAQDYSGEQTCESPVTVYVSQ